MYGTGSNGQGEGLVGGEAALARSRAAVIGRPHPLWTLAFCHVLRRKGVISIMNLKFDFGKSYLFYHEARVGRQAELLASDALLSARLILTHAGSLSSPDVIVDEKAWAVPPSLCSFQHFYFKIMVYQYVLFRSFETVKRTF